MTPFLHDQELAEMCRPLKQPAAIRRYLKRMGVPFQVRPDGRPLVSRNAVAQALGDRHAASSPEVGPNLEALKAVFARRKRADG